MVDINLAAVTDRGTTINDTDYLAIWPASVDATTDLEKVAVSSFKNYVNTAASTSFVTSTTIDAKGDLLVGTTNDTVGRLGAGANNTVLVADSDQATGLKWSTVGTAGITDYAVTFSKLKPLQVDTPVTGDLTLDFSGPGLVTNTVVDTATYTGTNYSAGATKTVRVVSGAGPCTLIFPSSWKFVGFKPSQMLPNKTAILTVTCFGSSASDCVAAWAVAV